MRLGHCNWLHGNNIRVEFNGKDVEMTPGIERRGAKRCWEHKGWVFALRSQGAERMHEDWRVCTVIGLERRERGQEDRSDREEGGGGSCGDSLR